MPPLAKGPGDGAQRWAQLPGQEPPWSRPRRRGEMPHERVLGVATISPRPRDGAPSAAPQSRPGPELPGRRSPPSRNHPRGGCGGAPQPPAPLFHPLLFPRGPCPLCPETPVLLPPSPSPPLHPEGSTHLPPAAPGASVGPANRPGAFWKEQLSTRRGHRLTPSPDPASTQGGQSPAHGGGRGVLSEADAGTAPYSPCLRFNLNTG